MISGIINVYKEKGFTSHDVVAKLRGILKQKKIGHTGTLDPDAEGVLPVCLGKATKVCDLLTDKDKEYEAVLLALWAHMPRFPPCILRLKWMAGNSAIWQGQARKWSGRRGRCRYFPLKL